MNEVYTCDYKFKIGALRVLLSENTFGGHWETVVDCMETLRNISNEGDEDE